MSLPNSQRIEKHNGILAYGWLTSGLFFGKAILLFTIFALFAECFDWKRAILFTMILSAIPFFFSFGEKTTRQKAQTLYIITIFLIFFYTLIRCMMLNNRADILETIPFFALLVFILIGFSCGLWEQRTELNSHIKWMPVSRTTKKAICVCLALLCFVCACVIAMKILYILCTIQPSIQNLWNSIRSWLGVKPHIGSISWVSLGATFLAGCLIVISWSKEIPCSTWNPYRAHELGIAKSYPFLGIGLWCCVVYASANDSPWLAAVLCIVLLCNSVMTSVRCYQLEDDQDISERIIYKLGWTEVIGSCISYPIVTEDDTTHQPILLPSSTSSDDAKVLIANYISELRFISSYVIQHMEKANCWQQVSAMQKLINQLAKKAGNHQNALLTAGLISGIGCVPYELTDCKQWKYYKYYLCQLYAKEISYSDDFHNYVAVGLLIGASLLYYHVTKQLPYQQVLQKEIDQIVTMINSRYKSANQASPLIKNPKLIKEYNRLIDELLITVEDHVKGIGTMKKVFTKNTQNGEKNQLLNDILTQLYQQE